MEENTRVAMTLSVVALGMIVLGSCAEHMQQSIAEPRPPTVRQELHTVEPSLRRKTEEKARALQNSIDQLHEIIRQRQQEQQ